MKSNLQGRHSVDFRAQPSKKVFNMVRNTASSQSNTRKDSKNSKRRTNPVQLSKRNRVNTDVQCLCSSAALSELFRTVVKLQKQKSVFGSNLEQIERITKTINQLNFAPLSLCNRLIRVIVQKQIAHIFPEVAKLISSILELLQQQKGEMEITRIITADIQNLERELKQLKRDQTQMKRSFQQGNKFKSQKIQQLLQTVKLQSLELQKLKKKYPEDLDQTKHKLSNMKYK